MIHGIPEPSFAEAASASSEEGNSHRFTPRQDTVSAVVECCKSRLGLEISSRDVDASYRIKGLKNG